MAGICTASVSPGNCGHRTLTVMLDGVSVDVPLEDAAAAVAFTADELKTFVALGLRRMRQRGVTLAQMANRVTHGDEATNLRPYDFVGPGSAITLTNIGTAYVNICPGLNGQRTLVDFTGCTQFRLILNTNLVGTGAFAARVIRDSDSSVLFESTNLGAVEWYAACWCW